MADEPLFSFDDEEPPAVLGKTDALIARHRGNGPDPSVPVLTDLASTAPAGEIPVLTHVEPIIGEELMFTPEEIRPEDFAPPAPPPLQHAVTAPSIAPPPTARPQTPPAPTEDLIAVPPLKPAREPIAAPVPAPAAPAATRHAPPAEFDFPDLTLPTARPAASKPAPAPVAPPPSVPAGQLMPELSLNFDFALPADEPPQVATPAQPVPMPPPVAAPPTAVLAPVPATARPAPVPSLSFPDEAPIEISLDDEEPVDAEALATELMAKLQPAMEKLVRTELARQSAAINVEVLKRTLGAIQPQLHKLIAAEVEAALKRN